VRIRVELGALLRRHRETRGLLQEQLATLVEPAVSRNTISNVERGLTRPYRHTLNGLAAALGLNAEERAELTAAWLAFGAEVADDEPEPVPPQDADAVTVGAGTPPSVTVSSFKRRLNNLPLHLTRFVGREQELAAIAARMRAPELRLLTLTGPGGIGKTRLALEAVKERLDGYADGAIFVALAPITEPTLVVAAIAQAVGVLDAGGNLRDSLRDFLRDKQLLLVLDNFEHLLTAAPLVPVLLAEAPGLNVLVTSREVLRISGEHTLVIPPLCLPPRATLPPLDQLTQNEAVRLFVERAQAVKPDFQVTNANAPAVAEICHQLEGLPLAIELAAARVRHVAPEALLLRLVRRLPVLTGGPRDLPNRQQTLRGALAWSYDLLTAAEQALFRRLAVFAGGCTLEAAEAVCVFDGASARSVRPGPSIDVLDGVASLVDKSLVRYEARADSEPRYTMLETVREYGLEQLVMADEEPLTRAQHAEYYEALIQRAVPHFYAAEQLVWLARMDDELDNLRVVLQWLLNRDQRERGQLLAGSLWFFWSIHSRVSDGREWLMRLLAGPAGKATPDQPRGRALLALGLIAAKQYDLAACDEAFTESLDLARRAGDARTTAMALVRSAWLSQRLDDSRVSPQRAMMGIAGYARSSPADYFEEALALFRRLGDDWGAAMCLSFYAEHLIFRDAVRARNLATEASEVARRVGERWAMGFSLYLLARLALHAGEPTEARRLLEQSLPLPGELNDLYSESQRLGMLAQLEMDELRFADALALHERRAANCRLLGNRPHLGHALHDLAIAARLTGDANRARQAYEESLALFQDLSQQGEVAAVTASLGHLYRQRGAFAAAAETFVGCLREFRSHDTELGVATVLAGLGWLALNAERPADAARLLGAAEGLLVRLETGPGGVLNTSQPGLRGLQFRRDTVHALELRTAGRPRFEAMGTDAFEAALNSGRELSTAEALAVGIELAECTAASADPATVGQAGRTSAEAR
jgi:predicted ATPase/transcriptional regulator with XRE-family HTH domain